MKRLIANTIKNLAGDGVTYTVTKEVKQGDQITLYLDNGFKYTLSITDYEWLRTKSSNVKSQKGFPPSFPYIGDLKAVSFREPIE